MIKQFILVSNKDADAKSQDFLKLMQHIAHLQDNRYQKLFEALRFRVKHEAEEASAEARELLQTSVDGLAQKYELNARAIRTTFAADLYPTEESPTAIFNADYTTDQGWLDSIRDPIGKPEQRANIIPANVTIDEALKQVSKNTPEYEKNNCTPIILEISEQYGKPTVLRHPNAANAQIIGIHPDQAFEYMCQELGIIEKRILPAVKTAGVVQL